MQVTISNTIPIIYKGNSYYVDPNLLCQASTRFKNMMISFFEEEEKGEPQLEILYENFSERNIENFLKICQNLQTDVQNSEIKEICEIAYMFQANDIYNKALSFVQKTIDPNFSIPDEKYDNSFAARFLHITTIGKLIHHLSNFSELEFESDESNEECADSHDNGNQIETIVNNNQTQDQWTNGLPDIYLIKSEFLSRGQRLMFIKNNKTTMTAKVKGKKIYLSDKSNLNQSKFTPKIERDSNLTSKAFLEGTEVNIKYILGKSSNFSMEVSFHLDDKAINWFPKDTDMKTKSSAYKQVISGRYHHPFKRSPINMALKDKNGETMFILRKVGHNCFEVECNSNIPDDIIFSIAASQIIGPFYDSIDVLSCGRESVMPTVPFSIA